MKAAAITGERQAEVVEVPTPQPTGDWVLVKIHAAPMCAEYKSFLRGNKSECLGHEAAGEVVQVAQPGPIKVGDRVVVMPQYPCGVCALCKTGDYIYCEHNAEYRGATMAQYILKPAWMLPKIPDGVSYEKASLACCGIGPSFGAMQALGVSTFDTILITGLGPVGMGALINAKYRGATVIAVESQEYRVKLANELGADHIIDPRDTEAVNRIKALCGGVGPDYALDCSGVVAAHRLCIDSVRRRGKIAFVGESSAETPIKISRDMLRKGIQLMGSWHYNLNEYPKIMQVIQRSPLIDKFITHIFPMSHIQEAFEVSASQNNAKIILKPWE